MHRSLHLSIIAPAALFALLLAVAGCETLGLGGSKNAFRVTPYLQHPAPDAMTVLWLAQDESPARITWWPADGGAAKSATVSPRLASELEYAGYTNCPAQTNYPSHFLPFTLPWQYRYRITGLRPDTLYHYRVELHGARYANSFRTAPGRGRAIRFTCFADSETEPESSLAVSPKRAIVSWEDPKDERSGRRYYIDQTTGFASNLVWVKRFEPDFMIYAGDLAEKGSKQVDWDEFWRHNAGPINDPAGSIPILAAPGNHEYHGYGELHGERGMRKYLSYFEFEPNDATVDEDQRERFHRLDYGPCTFLFIDPNNGPDDDAAKDPNRYMGAKTCRAPDFNPGSAQWDWIERNLADAQKRSAFIFVVCHQCPFSVGYHGRPNGDKGTEKYGEELSGTPTRVYTNLFSRYGVDAWFCGHDEMYEHSIYDGEEVLPDGTRRPNRMHVYDTGFAGDGLRGYVRTSAPNPYEVFRAHKDAPEVYDGKGILVDGGKHYGHLEVNVETNALGQWTTRIAAAYVFVTTNTLGQACGFDLRHYPDVAVLTNTTWKAESNGAPAMP